MPNWYDYVPVVGSVVEGIKGNGKQAAIDALGGPVGVLGQTIYDKYAGAVNEQKQGDLTAASQAASLGNNLYTQSMQGLNKAENYYLPAQQAIKAAYGSPGAITGGPSQYPVAPSTVKR